MKRLIPFAAIALLLAGCASTPTVYQASTGPGVAGFSEYRIEPGRYRVTFVGGPGAPAAQVNDYALLRAAELALRDGYDWFRVSDRFTEGRGDPNGSRLSLGVGGGNYGWHSGVGPGGGHELPAGRRPAPSGYAGSHDGQGRSTGRRRRLRRARCARRGQRAHLRLCERRCVRRIRARCHSFSSLLWAAPWAPRAAT
jgi:hypothetical protein